MSKPKLAAKSLKAPRSTQKRPQKCSRESHERAKKAKREYAKQRYDALTPAERAELRWRRSAKPPQPTPGSARSQRKRHVAVARAYCDWSDIDEVVRMYCAAAVMTELTGVPYTVDHVVPLQHELVCGLHTHTNMEVISLPENEIKGNRFWPDMWGDGSSEALVLIERLGKILEQQREDRLKVANDDEHSRSAAGKRRRGRGNPRG